MSVKAFFICLLFLCWQKQEHAAIRSENHHLIDLFSSEAGIRAACYRIPAFARTPDGVLLAAADQRMPSCRDLGQNEDINIVLRRSLNGGKSWSEMKTVVDFPVGISASDPSFIVDGVSKQVFLFFNRMDLIKEKGEYHFQYISSTDNGKTWSQPFDITNQVSHPEWKLDFQFITSGNGVQTAEGTLLHTFVHVGQQAAYVFGSADHGRTWFRAEAPVLPADESRVIGLPDGKWMVNARVNKAGFRYVHTSGDRGRTWKSSLEPQLPDPGCNAALIGRSGKGGNILLFLNAASAKSRENLTFTISRDGGKNWKPEAVLYPGSSAYVSADWVGRNEVGILFERDDYSRISYLTYRLR